MNSATSHFPATVFLAALVSVLVAAALKQWISVLDLHPSTTSVASALRPNRTVVELSFGGGL